jgi:hypothetical protein
MTTGKTATAEVKPAQSIKELTTGYTTRVWFMTKAEYTPLH